MKRAVVFPDQHYNIHDVKAMNVAHQVLKKIKPDIVLVHGDTTTAFTTSLACFYNNIAVAHVEAGLRTNNISSPYPEEFNRQMVSKIANIHFAPTNRNVNNLLLEGIKKKQNCTDWKYSNRLSLLDN